MFTVLVVAAVLGLWLVAALPLAVVLGRAVSAAAAPADARPALDLAA